MEESNDKKIDVRKQITTNLTYAINILNMTNMKLFLPYMSMNTSPHTKIE